MTTPNPEPLGHQRTADTFYSHTKINTYIHTYVGINLSKEVKDLYTEKYKTLIKETADDLLKKCTDSPCSWTGRINTVEVAIPPKVIYTFNVISIKLTMTFFTRTNNPKVYMEPQKIHNCQNNLEEKEQNRKHHPPRLLTILQSYSNQNGMVLAERQTYRSMQQSREPRNKHTRPWSIHLQQRTQEYTL